MAGGVRERRCDGGDAKEVVIDTGEGRESDGGVDDRFVVAIDFARTGVPRRGRSARRS